MNWTPSRTLRLRRESWGFAIGSALFAVGAWPGYGEAVGARWDNLTYFLGSLFFTAAGFIQFRLSGRPVPGAESHQIERYDWWSALIQFVGTLCSTSAPSPRCWRASPRRRSTAGCGGPTSGARWRF